MNKPWGYADTNILFIFQDLDEFLVPRTPHNSLTDMLHNINATNAGNILTKKINIGLRI